MSFTFSTVTTAADRVATDLLVVGAAKGGDLGPGAASVDAALGGALAAFRDETGFEGRLGETLSVPTAGIVHRRATLLVDPRRRTYSRLPSDPSWCCSSEPFLSSHLP